MSKVFFFWYKGMSKVNYHYKKIKLILQVHVHNITMPYY
jgi:hypothetical protein